MSGWMADVEPTSPPCGRGYKIEALGERKPPKLQILLVRGAVLLARRTIPLAFSPTKGEKGAARLAAVFTAS